MRGNKRTAPAYAEIPESMAKDFPGNRDVVPLGDVTHAEALSLGRAKADEINFPLDVVHQGTRTTVYPKALRRRGY